MTRWMYVFALAAIGAACQAPAAPPAPVAETAAAPAAPAPVSPAPPAAAAPARVDVRPAAEARAAAPRTPQPRFRDITLPSGTTLQLELRSAIASDTSQVDDMVRAELRSPVTVDGETVLPAGTELVGVVTDVERSGRVKGVARIAYRFDSLRYAGERYDIRADPITHEARATKKQDAAKIGIGAGVGAAVGGLLGGGSGALKGAAIGGAGGTGVVLATRGEEVRRDPGADVATQLTEPLTVRVRL